MSCRVLNRGMENFTFNKIVEYAKENGFKKIIGEYIETPKNKVVRSHYQKLGFSPIDSDGQKLFELEVDDYEKKECFIS